jgi:hypothetical protein
MTSRCREPLPTGVDRRRIRFHAYSAELIATQRIVQPSKTRPHSDDKGLTASVGKLVGDQVGSPLIQSQLTGLDDSPCRP